MPRIPFELKPEERSHPAITHARMHKVIIEMGADTPNADIEYECGYLNGTDFISLGFAHEHYQDADEVTEMQEDPANPGQQISVVVSAAKTDYTDFISQLDLAPDVPAAAAAFLKGRKEIVA